MVDLNFKLKSMVLTIGPSHCGKTYFCKNVLLPSLKSDPSLNVQYISSDDTRRELLGVDLSNMDKKMMYVSEPAFRFMEYKVASMMKFPVMADFIVVDATLLDEKTRDAFISVARDNCYNVYAIKFDYDSRDEYMSFVPDSKEIVRVVNNHVTKFKKELRSISRISKHGVLYRIKSRDLSGVSVSIDPCDVKKRDETTLPDDDVVVISDINGCYDSLVELLYKCGFGISGGKIVDNSGYKRTLVINGDFIDKGDKVLDVVGLLYDNIGNDIVKVIKGNHENFVYKYLKGEIDESGDMLDYFDSINMYKDAGCGEIGKFFSVIESCVDFCHNNFVYVTHAPCRNKHVGKFDIKSIRGMRSFSYNIDGSVEDKDKHLEGMLSFIVDESVCRQPYHCFGHIAVSNPRALGNKVFLDGGAVYGGKLVAATFTPDMRVKFASVRCDVKREGRLYDLFGVDNCMLNNIHY